MIFRKLVSGLAFFAVFAGPAGAYEWCEVPEIGLSEDDQSRLVNLDISRTRGLGAAMRSESVDDRAVVAELFEPGVPYASATLVAGAYACRTLKLGGNLPLVVYSWFSCEITEEGDGTFAIRKLTGSQNFAGTLFPAGSGFAFKGASYYGYEDGTIQYGDDPERNEVGCLSAVTKENKHFVLEFPFPKLESFHDVIELRPAS